jgi:hypothetical protein
MAARGETVWRWTRTSEEGRGSTVSGSGVKICRSTGVTGEICGSAEVGQAAEERSVRGKNEE